MRNSKTTIALLLRDAKNFRTKKISPDTAIKRVLRRYGITDTTFKHEVLRCELHRILTRWIRPALSMVNEKSLTNWALVLQDHGLDPKEALDHTFLQHGIERYAPEYRKLRREIGGKLRARESVTA